MRTSLRRISLVTENRGATESHAERQKTLRNELVVQSVYDSRDSVLYSSSTQRQVEPCTPFQKPWAEGSVDLVGCVYDIRRDFVLRHCDVPAPGDNPARAFEN